MNYQNKGNTPKSSQMKTIYITLGLSLAVMAVLIILSGALSRSNETKTPDVSTDVMGTVPDVQVIAPHTEKTTAVTTVASETVSETENTTEITSEITTATTAAPTAEELPLPEFTAPVAGYLMKGHSGDTPVFSVTMNDYRPHIGVDLSASIGDDVFAVAEGTVKDIWEDPMAGNCISIEHTGGAVSIYSGLDPALPEGIAAGTEVSAGEVIGTVGDSSLLEVADEPHIHFELTVNGESVDPAEYISFHTADTEYEG